MTELNQVPDPRLPGGLMPPGDPRGRWRRAMLSAAVVLVGGGLAGLAGGLVWAQVSPHAVFQVTSPGSADLVHLETTAFVTTDLLYCLVGLVGGLVIGVAGDLLAVRRHGVLPMFGIVGGSVLAGVAARWAGEHIGLSAFNTALATKAPGAMLSAPVVLGAHNAIACWPLAACAAAGVLELMALLRDRRVAGRVVPPHYMLRG